MTLRSKIKWIIWSFNRGVLYTSIIWWEENNISCTNINHWSPYSII